MGTPAATPTTKMTAARRMKRLLFSYMLYPSFLPRHRHHSYKQSSKSPPPSPSTSSTFFRPTSMARTIAVRNNHNIEENKQLRVQHHHGQQQSLHKFFCDSL